MGETYIFWRDIMNLFQTVKAAVSPRDAAEAEVEGIFLWAYAGLQRLKQNRFRFTESDRARENREAAKRDNNNIVSFLESDGYIRLKADGSIPSKDLYAIYRMWCDENGLLPLKGRSFSDAVVANASKYNLEHCNNVTNPAGRRVWGFLGIEAVAAPRTLSAENTEYETLRTYIPYT